MKDAPLSPMDLATAARSAPARPAIAAVASASIGHVVPLLIIDDPKLLALASQSQHGCMKLCPPSR